MFPTSCSHTKCWCFPHDSHTTLSAVVFIIIPFCLMLILPPIYSSTQCWCFHHYNLPLSVGVITVILFYWVLRFPPGTSANVTLPYWVLILPLLSSHTECWYFHYRYPIYWVLIPPLLLSHTECWSFHYCYPIISVDPSIIVTPNWVLIL